MLFRSEVVYESINKIHVSGHGCQDELMMMLKAVQPKFFVPIHGEYRHLAMHSKLARKAGVKSENIRVVENGQVLELSKRGMNLGERLEFLKGVIVGGQYMEGAAEIFIQRNNLAKTGVVVVVLTSEHPGGDLLQYPKIVHHGLLLQRDTDPSGISAEAEERLYDLYPSLQGREDRDELIRLEVRRLFKRYASHKPAVIPVWVEPPSP